MNWNIRPLGHFVHSARWALCSVLATASWAAQAHPHVGKVIEYSVAGYTIRMEMLSERTLRWTYLQAPTAAEKGQSAIETIDHVVLRDDLLLAAWTEKSGTQVVDVFDFGQRRVVANFVMPDGKRYLSQANFTLQKP